jgi:hypothetical protein
MRTETYSSGNAERSIRVRWTLAAWVILGLLAAFQIPIGLVEGMRSICLFRQTLDWECPGCGMTRALFHLLHLDITGAWQHNKLSVVVAPLLATVLLKKIFIYPAAHFFPGSVTSHVMRPTR